MGAEQHHAFPLAGQVVLAHEQPFALGKVRVDPPRRQVQFEDRSETLEPRVMQVLVALARAEGGIVTRDELIQYCWSGRIVGDDSINRALSRLRRIAAGIAQGSFTVETISRVGYRLIVEAPRPEKGSAAAAHQESGERSVLARRPVLAGFGLLAVAAMSGGAWIATRPPKHVPEPEALAYFRKGTDEQRSGSVEQVVQAVADLEFAVAADPSFADAWGALAIAYAQMIDTKPITDMQLLEERSEAAAARALELEPDNSLARVAHVLVRSTFRNWEVLERDYRRLMRAYPDQWILPAALGRLLFDVGRIEEGLSACRRALHLDHSLPSVSARTGWGLWSAGRLFEADRFFAQAAARWPGHYGIWFSRFSFLAYSGRANAAVATAHEALASPLGLPRDLLSNALLAAKAMLAADPAAVTAAAQAVDNGPAEHAIYFLSSAGRLDEAFARARRYLTRESWPDGWRNINPRSRRYPLFLFAPPAARMRADPRFEPLVRDAGLSDYWQAARVLPDYRR